MNTWNDIIPSQKAYISTTLRGISDDIYDTYRTDTGIKTQSVGVKTSVASGTTINYSDMASAGQFVAYYADGTKQTGVKGDTLTASAIILHYQLNTPVTTAVPKQEIECFPGGSVRIWPFVGLQLEEYGTGITIADATLPIETLSYCYKLDLTTGEYINVISFANVAADGLSFTVTGMQATDIVEYGYTYDSSLATYPIIGYSTPLSVTMPIPLTGEGTLFDPVWIGTVNRLVVK